MSSPRKWFNFFVFILPYQYFYEHLRQSGQTLVAPETARDGEKLQRFQQQCALFQSAINVKRHNSIVTGVLSFDDVVLRMIRKSHVGHL